jgi:hypothetical protein
MYIMDVRRLILFLIISSYVQITFQCTLHGVDSFGANVFVSGNTILVSAPQDSSNATLVNGEGSNNVFTYSGAAYTLIRTPDGWMPEAYFKPPNPGEFDFFTRALDIDGDIIVIGADLEDGANSDPFNDDAPDSGAVYVYVREEGNWRFDTYLKASNAEQLDWFGHAVTITGNTLVVGAPAEDSNGQGENPQEDNSVGNSGAVYVFERNGEGEWTQTAYLKAPTPGFGDLFGHSVSISGNRLVAGAPDAIIDVDEPPGFNDPGYACVFVKSGNNWNMKQRWNWRMQTTLRKHLVLD